jgi:hypothetical protein
MKNQKATWETLPAEIKEKMLEYQLEQTGKKDENIFIKYKIGCDKFYGGFNWNKTEYGFDFWFQVLSYSNFNLFFEKYPKPVFTPIEKKLNDTYNIVNIIKKNKEQIKFINDTYYNFDIWGLPVEYYQEVKKMKMQNEDLLNQLFKLHENEK